MSFRRPLSEKIQTFYFSLSGDVALDKGDELSQFILNLAEKLDLKGWVHKTREETVDGYIEGKIKTIDEFKNWFLPGSCPVARLEKATFGFEEPIEHYSVVGFAIHNDDGTGPEISRVTTDYIPIFDDPLEGPDENLPEPVRYQPDGGGIFPDEFFE